MNLSVNVRHACIGIADTLLILIYHNQSQSTTLYKIRAQGLGTTILPCLPLHMNSKKYCQYSFMRKLGEQLIHMPSINLCNNRTKHCFEYATVTLLF